MYEIADFLGFQNAYYFSSWFKREVGVTPTEYRADPGSAQARKN
jgi:two-component system response regulator YesN